MNSMNHPPRIGCLIMAAGNASRFGSNKLAAKVDGKMLIEHALETVPREEFARVTVVTQYDEAVSYTHLRIKAQIKIDYEEQTPAVTIDDGIHCVGGPMFPEKNSNVMCELFCEKGRPMDEVFAEADEVFEETIETPYQEHVHLETNSAIADMERCV